MRKYLLCIIQTSYCLFWILPTDPLTCHRTGHKPVDVSRDAQLLTEDLLVFVKGHELDSSVGKYPDHHGPIAFIKPQVTLLPWHDTESSYHTSRREGGERA